MKKLYFPLLFPLLLTTFMARATVHIITVKNFEFSPSSLDVSVGDTVMWVRDEVNGGTHTTTSGIIPTGADAWDAPLNQSSPNFSYVVAQPGTYNYACSIHPSMIGSFTATETTGTTAAIPEPFFTMYNTVVRDQLTIGLKLTAPTNVKIRLYNLSGALVRNLEDSRLSAGARLETYSIGDHPKGIYVLEIFAGKNRAAQRILIE